VRFHFGLKPFISFPDHGVGNKGNIPLVDIHFISSEKFLHFNRMQTKSPPI
jgi:hypothetical protein